MNRWNKNKNTNAFLNVELEEKIYAHLFSVSDNSGMRGVLIMSSSNSKISLVTILIYRVVTTNRRNSLVR